jgi:gentisate 1,2-dioxygenase
MVWLDGLDMPLVSQLDGPFFEFGHEEVTDRSTPPTSRSEALFGHPGLVPLGVARAAPGSPLAAYRWEHTDAALRAQHDLEDAGHPGVVGPGHAAVRMVDPTTGCDALPTIRLEMHRLRAGTSTLPRRTVGSSVWQVFDGNGDLDADGEHFDLVRGDVVALPSWCRWSITASAPLDLFVFSDAPVHEALHLDRTEPGPTGTGEGTAR